MKKPIYNSLQQWAQAEPLAYGAAVHKGLLPEILEKFFPPSLKKQKLVEEIIEKKSIKRKRKKHFRKNIKRKGKKPAIKNINSIIETSKKLINIQNKFDCIQEASKHKTPWDWEKASPDTYNAAKAAGWLEECGKNLKPL